VGTIGQLDQPILQGLRKIDDIATSADRGVVRSGIRIWVAGRRRLLRAAGQGGGHAHQGGKGESEAPSATDRSDACNESHRE
jgi:hypothetical protein